MLAHRVGAVKQTILQCAVGRLAGCLEDRAVGVEQPAVVAAANPLLRDQPELERSAAVGAMKLQQSDRPAAVAEGDEILPQDAQPTRQVAQLLRQHNRLPKMAHIFAARRSRPDARELLVLRRPLAVVVGAVSRAEQRNPVSHLLLLDDRTIIAFLEARRQNPYRAMVRSLMRVAASPHRRNPQTPIAKNPLRSYSPHLKRG